MSELRTRRPAVFRYDDPAVVATLPAIVAAGRSAEPAGAAAPPAVGRDVLDRGVRARGARDGPRRRQPDRGPREPRRLARRPRRRHGGLAAVALLVIVAREVIALARLSEIESLHKRAVEILASDERTAGRALVRDLLALTQADAAPRAVARAPRGPSRRHHRRRRPHPARRARADGAARRGGAPAGVRRREARLGGHRSEPARRNRRVLRPHHRARPGAQARAALRRPARGRSASSR